MIRILFILPLLLLAYFVPAHAKEPASKEGEAHESIIRQTTVLVELFTSQGCNHCPKANRFLTKLAKDPNILPLSFSVEYWDYLGWKDTFAMSDFTKRQRAYVHALQLRNLYTPQMIIDGRISIKGTKQRKVKYLIEAITETPVQGPKLSFQQDGKTLHLRVGAGNAPAGGAVILIADFIPGVQKIQVLSGENTGQIVDQVNVVTRLRTLGPWTGGAIEFDIAPPKNARACVAILQEPGPGRVLAIARLNNK